MQPKGVVARLLLVVTVIGLLAAWAEPGVVGPAPMPLKSESLAVAPGFTLQGQANGDTSLSVVSTLVLFNNTLVPGNFLAANGGAPVLGCVDATRHLAYALSYGILSVINESTYEIVGGVFVGTNNRGIACNPAANEVFVADAQANLLYVIDATTFAVVSSISVGQQPQAVAYDSGTGEIYVGNSLSNDVTVVDGVNRTVMATIPVGSPVWGLAYDSGKGEVFASLGPANTVTVISDTSHAVVASVDVGYFPQGLAYDAVDGEVFIANEQSNNVSVISDASNTVVGGIATGTGPVTVAYDPVSGSVWVANSYSGDVSILSASSQTLLGTVYIGGGAGGVQVDPGTGLAFVDATSTATVVVINIAARSIVAQIPTGAFPESVAYASGSGEIFVGTGSQGTVEIISERTNHILASVPVGLYPRHLAFDSKEHVVLVPCLTQVSNTMFVISDTTNTLVANVSIDGIVPTSVAVDPDRGLIFVGDAGSPPQFPAKVTVYNDTSFEVVKSLTVGGDPETILYDAGRGETFVGSTDGEGNGVVYVIEDATLSIVANVTVAPGPYPRITSLAYDPELGEILVADNKADVVHVISDVTNTVIANVTGLAGPQALAYLGGGYVFVTGNGTFGSLPTTPGFVSVISDAANSVVSTVAVGGSPDAAVYDPQVDAAYVVNFAQGTLSVVRTAHNYEVGFQESGLPARTPWSVVLGGRTARTLNDVIAYQQPNGSYAYSVASESGYVVTQQTGNATVSGASVSVMIVFQISPTSGPPAVFPWLAVIEVAISSVILVTLGLASALDEGVRFLAIATVAFPFFTLRREEALDHFVRGQIFEYLRDHPGATYTEIKARLSLNNGTAAHHLRVLEKMGFLVSKRDGRMKRFFHVDAPAKFVPSVLSPLQYNILSLLAQEPLSQSDLARRLDYSKQRVSYNVKRLRRDGYVDLERDGRVLHVTVKGSMTLAHQDSIPGEV